MIVLAVAGVGALLAGAAFVFKGRLFSHVPIPSESERGEVGDFIEDVEEDLRDYLSDSYDTYGEDYEDYYEDDL